jgi:hypothetical protein
MLATAIRRTLSSSSPPLPTRLGLTKGLWLACLALAASFALDTLSTGIFLATSTAHEANPLIALVLRGGLPALALVKLSVLALVFVFARVLAIDSDPAILLIFRICLYACAGLYVIISASNLMAGLLGEDLLHFCLAALAWLLASL